MESAMDWACKAALTATTVALLLTVAQHFGRRVAGILAGLPTVTGPALVWLAVDFGSAYAIAAAIGSIAACVLCALFALAYERASRRCGIAVTLGAATAACGLVAPPLQWLASDLALALLTAGGATLAIHAAIPAGRDDGVARPGLPGELWITALVSGTVSGAVAATAPAIGPFWAGVLASPPLIAAAVASHQHAFIGSRSVRAFLRGYVLGLFGRAIFGASFAVMLVPFGVTGATLLAAAAGCVLSMTALRHEFGLRISRN
jgi:hypothetical protein